MSPCRKCEAECCRHIALQIDTPREKEDFECIRWYLTHKKASVFVEKHKWFLEVFNECEFISDDHKCLIYDKRPQVCRDYEAKDCVFWAEGDSHDYYFHDLKAFDDYLLKRFKRKKKTL